MTLISPVPPNLLLEFACEIYPFCFSGGNAPPTLHSILQGQRFAGHLLPWHAVAVVQERLNLLGAGLG
jgi:hypothetical protein